MTGKPASKYGGLRKAQTAVPEAPAPAPDPLLEAMNSGTLERQNSRTEEPEISGKPEKFGTMLTPETARRLRVHAAQHGMRDWQVVEAAVAAYLREHEG